MTTRARRRVTDEHHRGTVSTIARVAVLLAAGLVADCGFVAIGLVGLDAMPYDPLWTELGYAVVLVAAVSLGITWAVVAIRSERRR